MGDSAEKKALFRAYMDKFPLVSNRSWEIVLKLFHIDVLEMEDVLFHHNSAVMMPSGPDPDEADQEGAEESQEKLSGLAALASVLCFLDRNPQKRFLIAGHTDTSGTADINFRLSALRAQNILFLLTRKRKEWAEICVQRHKVEDYQQILLYVATRKKGRWLCHPGEVDNKWGPKTQKATEKFISSYNNEMNPPPEDRLDPFLTARRIDQDPNHVWPVELWQLVFDVYQTDMAKFALLKPANLTAIQSKINPVDSDRPWVGCGESFPIDKAQVDGRRSQENRRVEILVFDADEMHEKIVCPARVKTIHTESECPLWPNVSLLPLRIDPRDVLSVTYHLAFKYVDRIKNAVCDIPEGLEITAFENGNNKLDVNVVYQKTGSGGVYAVKVFFETALDDSARKSLHFEFAAEKMWVHRSAADADATIVEKTADEIKELNKPEKYAERRQYYDLPPKWSSRNYRTMHGGKLEGTDRFEEVLKNKASLRPFGNNLTTKDKPLVFSLDDVVLLDVVGGTQDIKDVNHSRPPVVKALSDTANRQSRVKILQVDPATGLLQLYTKGAKPHTARIPFAKNCILEKPEDVKNACIVFFRDGFYTIGDKRTKEEPGWINKGFVVGARAAIRDDADFHVKENMLHTNNEWGATGDYEIHWFHHQHLDAKHPVSYLVKYVSISFMKDVRGGAHAPTPGAADVTKYVDEGVYDAMAHWNRKRYFLEEKVAGDDTEVVRPFYFFDERETFKAAAPAAVINFDERPNHNALFTDAAIRNAQTNALGGRSKFLGFVCRDENGHWGPAYHWNIRNEGANHYSLFKLNKSGWTSWPGMFTGVPVTEHSDSFGAHTFAHELGHATGHEDEYIKSFYQPDPTQNFTFPNLEQHFVAYSMPANGTSMMYGNGSPRLHHCWYVLHWLNEKLKTNPLKKMLDGKEFVVRLDRTCPLDSRYSRHLGPATATTYQKPKKLNAPWKRQGKLALSVASKSINLALHDVGRDEASIKYFHANQLTGGSPIEYQAVLVVRVLLYLTFTGAGWNNADRLVRVWRFEQAWNNLREHYRLIGGDKDVKNVYIQFLAGYTASAADAHLGDRNFTINFASANHPGAGDRIPNAAATLTVYKNVTATELLRYILDETPDAHGVYKFDFMKNWVNAQLGDTFTIQHF